MKAKAINIIYVHYFCFCILYSKLCWHNRLKSMCIMLKTLNYFLLSPAYYAQFFNYYAFLSIAQKVAYYAQYYHYYPIATAIMLQFIQNFINFNT